MLPETTKERNVERGLFINTNATRSASRVDAKLNIQNADCSPRMPGSIVDNEHTLDNTMRRSDTRDSLAALVGRFSSLAHLDNIESLPSPTIKRDAFGDRRSSTRSTNSETEGEALSADSNVDPSKLAQDAIKNSEQRALPAKLIARLQGGDRGLRHASEAMPQPVSTVVMPVLQRGRSQSQVPQFLEAAKMQREASALCKDRQTPDTEGGHQLHDKSDSMFDIPCGTRICTFRKIGEIGEGTFSNVVLAENIADQSDLVAIKSVQFADADPLDRARMEVTVSREIALLEKIKHPLIIRMRGYLKQDASALMALKYCAGGDLFTLASEHRSLLTLRVVRRIFAELVTAVRLLHGSHVVHRDLKLENILMRQSSDSLKGSGPFSSLLTTLTDLGLARDFDPESPNLRTRCGSEDYAAPEIIMGQQYDGRQTDAWALGAILYCLLEGRLPFDVIPGLEHRMITKVLHRICRIEWRWVALKEAGSYDPDWDGAKRIVTNLLRSRTKRWTLDMVADDEWLKEDIRAVEALVESESE